MINIDWYTCFRVNILIAAIDIRDCHDLLCRCALYLFCMYNVTKYKERTGKHLRMDRPFILHTGYSSIIPRRKMPHRLKIVLAKKITGKEEKRSLYFVIKRKVKIYDYSPN